MDLHPFCSMPISPLILGMAISPFDLESPNQDHSSRSYSGFNIPSTHIPFTPCKFAAHSWDTCFFKFDPENPRSRSRVRSKFKVTKQVWLPKGQGHIVDPTSCPFCSMLINPPIPEIQLFQNLTLKIQGQGRGRGQSSKPQSLSHFLLIHIHFVPCKLALLFLRYSFFNIAFSTMLHNYRLRQFRLWTV